MRLSQLPEGFDPDEYLLLNPDVRATGMDPGEHYLQFGHLEKRRWKARENASDLGSTSQLPEGFDPDEYLLLNPDLRVAGLDPREHYSRFGHLEKRRWKVQLQLPEGFDPDEYLLLNPDLRVAGLDPREHYSRFGHLEKRRWRLRGDSSSLGFETQLPEGFDPDEYLRLNPDVRATGYDARLHYLQSGHREERRWKDSFGLGFKMFFIGFNKCGTRSLHQYFYESGLWSYHGGGDINSHFSILMNIAMGLPALSDVDHFDVYSDVGAIQSQFKHIDRDYPGSKFVLNVRDIDRWLVSRLNHLDGRYVEFMNLFYSTNRTWTEWCDRWRKEFVEHERGVLEHFGQRGNDFMRFDVEKDALADLISFIDAGLPPRAQLPSEGVTATKYYAVQDGRIVQLARPRAA